MKSIKFLAYILALLLISACSDDEDPAIHNTNGFEGKKINTIQRVTATSRENEVFVYDGNLLSERNSERRSYSICPDSTTLNLSIKYNYSENHLKFVTRKEDILSCQLVSIFEETQEVIIENDKVKVIQEENIIAEFRYDKEGRLVFVDNGEFEILYEYDASGNIITEIWSNEKSPDLEKRSDFKYDDQTNPFQVIPPVLPSEVVRSINKNNIVEETISLADGTILKEKYQYEYDGDYPIKVTLVESGQSLPNDTTEIKIEYLE